MNLQIYSIYVLNLSTTGLSCHLVSVSAKNTVSFYRQEPILKQACHPLSHMLANYTHHSRHAHHAGQGSHTCMQVFG